MDKPPLPAGVSFPRIEKNSAVIASIANLTTARKIFDREKLNPGDVLVLYDFGGKELARRSGKPKTTRRRA